MGKKIVYGTVLILLLIGMLILASDIQPVKASGSIWIRSDGSVDPDTAPISTVDNVTYTFTDDIYDAIGVERSNIIIDGNGYTLQGSGSGNGFFLCNVNNVTIKRTKIKGFAVGIELFWRSCLNTISGNNITENSEYGIRLLGLWQMSGPCFNTISGNNITQNNGCGIALELLSGFNTISGNNITRNTLSGITLSGFLGYYPCYNMISGNSITYNGHGICPLGGFDNTISGNNITENSEYGIWLYRGFVQNTIYHNNFVNNTEQVYTDGLAHVWDDGYPSGGNYWSDYSIRYPTVVDDYHGENQDILGSDGIWDSPYVIDVNNQDNYPFVIPWFLDMIPPVADAGPNQTVDKDAVVTLEGWRSTDNVGVTSWTWTFTDVTPQTLTGENVTYTFTTPGIYTVTLEVSDAAGNHATDTVTITVLSLTPEKLLRRLMETIESWNLRKGTENSLTLKLEDVLHLVDIGNENGAIHKLMDFINQVEALRGMKLTIEQADYLTAEAQRIIDLIKG